LNGAEGSAAGESTWKVFARALASSSRATSASTLRETSDWYFVRRIS
jgi:hypothetical protein